MKCTGCLKNGTRGPGQLPDRDHSRYPRIQRCRWPAACGQIPTPRDRRARESGPAWLRWIWHPLTLISEAVYARCLSARRRNASRRQKCCRLRRRSLPGDKQALLSDLEQALYASKIISYTPGICPSARRREGVQMGPELRRHRPCSGGAAASSGPHFSRRSGRIRRQPAAVEPAAGPVFQRTYRAVPAGLATRSLRRRPSRRMDPRHVDGVVLLR